MFYETRQVLQTGAQFALFRLNYFVPAEAVNQFETRVATLEEVMAHIEATRAEAQPVLDYLRDK